MNLLTTFVLVVGIAAVLVLSQNHPDCGKKGPKENILGIINGSDVSPYEFPWQLALAYFPNWNLNDTTKLSICGASLLNELWALTAAHCVFNDDGILRPVGSQLIIAGKYKLMEFDPGAVARQVVGYFPHPDYNHTPKDYDFALVKLNQSIDLNLPHIGTICLPDKQNLDDIAGHDCVATGWGFNGKEPFSNILQKAYAQIWPQSECRKSSDQLTDRMLCWGQPYNFSLCFGDSGGPLACKMQDNKWYEYGVASYVNGRVDNACIYDRFARVSEVTDWIWNTIKEHS